MRRIALALLLLAVAATVHAAPAWRERYLANARCWRSGEATACRDSLAAMRALLPGHPAVLYQTALNAMRLGDRAAALRALSAYADMGLMANVELDSTFRDLQSDSSFARIVRRLQDNLAPMAGSSVIHRFDDPDLLVEDVAWDARRKRYLVSSILKRKVIAVDAGGRESDLTLTGVDSLWGVFGLGIDAKRDRLWLTTAATAEVPGVLMTERGRTALVRYDLAGRAASRRYLLPVDDQPHVFGDVLVAADGTVHVTDSVSGGLYRVRAEGDSLETVVAPGQFASPQMMAPGSAGRLLVADYSRGIASVDLATGTVRWLDVPDRVATAGIDGLYRDGDRLLAIQNGVAPKRVLAFTLSPDGDRILKAEVIERASPHLGEPSHGVFVNGEFVIIGNSGWDRIGRDGKLQPGTAEQGTVLLRIAR